MRCIYWEYGTRERMLVIDWDSNKWVWEQGIREEVDGEVLSVDFDL